MNRFRFVVLSGLALCIAVCWTVPARAIKPFKDGFEAKYVKPDSKAPADAALAAAVKQAKCTICHMGKSKKQRNPYGAQLAKLLNRERDKDDKAKIEQALEKVAAMKSDPSDPKAPTFGERISQGKLPAAK